MNPVLFSSEREDWETPNEFFRALNAEFGFTLDAAANHKNHKCPKYYTPEEDALTQDWGGEIVWCNPPYGRNIREWVKKAYEESQKPNTVVVLLIHSRTDTAWFHDWVYGKARLRFVRGRLKFGGSKNPAPFPSLIAIYGVASEGEV